MDKLNLSSNKPINKKVGTYLWLNGNKTLEQFKAMVDKFNNSNYSFLTMCINILNTNGNAPKTDGDWYGDKLVTLVEYINSLDMDVGIVFQNYRSGWDGNSYEENKSVISDITSQLKGLNVTWLGWNEPDLSGSLAWPEASNPTDPHKRIDSYLVMDKFIIDCVNKNNTGSFTNANLSFATPEITQPWYDDSIHPNFGELQYIQSTGYFDSNDALSFHCYPNTGHDNGIPESMLHLSSLEFAKQYKPLLITEVGWPDDSVYNDDWGPGSTPSNIANYYVRALLVLDAMGFCVISTFTAEGQFGILHIDENDTVFTEKGKAIKNLLDNLEGYTFSYAIDLPDKQNAANAKYSFIYKKPNAPDKLVYWGTNRPYLQEKTVDTQGNRTFTLNYTDTPKINTLD